MRQTTGRQLDALQAEAEALELRNVQLSEQSLGFEGSVLKRSTPRTPHSGHISYDIYSILHIYNLHTVYIYITYCYLLLLNIEEIV